MATTLFETLDGDINASLKEILARIESVELGNCIMELVAAGQKKGNFESSLAGALGAIEQYTAQKQDGLNESTEDQSEFLRRVYDSKEKTNPHNVGMV